MFGLFTKKVVFSTYVSIKTYPRGTNPLFVSLLAVSLQTKETLFESLPASQTNIRLPMHWKKHNLFNILYYLYYYNGGGVATGDINNDGLTDIYFTANHKNGNKLLPQ